MCKDNIKFRYAAMRKGSYLLFRNIFNTKRGDQGQFFR